MVDPILANFELLRLITATAFLLLLLLDVTWEVWKLWREKRNN